MGEGYGGFRHGHRNQQQSDQRQSRSQKVSGSLAETRLGVCQPFHGGILSAPADTQLKNRRVFEADQSG
jgi:hypothetical protein